jgi:hypothetical protein
VEHASFRLTLLSGLCEQVKSTIHRSPEGGYTSKVTPSASSKPYQPGEFDFLAAYVIAENV